MSRRAFRDLLERANAEPAENEGAKEATPFYVLQQELEARAIVEGLRLTNWKLRPAARLLGISPMKLRGSLRKSLAEVLRHSGDAQAAAAALDIPLDILLKKLDDLGLTEVPS